MLNDFDALTTEVIAIDTPFKSVEYWASPMWGVGILGAVVP